MADEPGPIGDLVEAVLKGQEQIRRLEKRIAVLFADLCDSTSYKLSRGDVDGLLKTYRHNQIVGAAVTERDGVIVKYIGDEVMATFEGDGAAERAVGAAIAIQASITIVNEQIAGPPDERIASKIGINVGTALLVTFPGHEAPDPQGKVVDAAARIIALAQPGQILCSAQVKAELPENIQLSEAHNREAKGILDGVQVYEVRLDGAKWQVPKRNRHSDVRTPSVQAHLKRAFASEHTRKFEAAISQYDAVLHTPFPNGDRAHFVANYRKARILFRNMKQLHATFEDICALVEQAQASCPESGQAKALALVVRWHANAQDDQPAEFWDQLIQEAREALEMCQRDCDLYGEIVAMNLLASLISERMSFDGADRTLLAEARELCVMLRQIFDDLQSHLIPAFYETHASVLLRSGDKSEIDKAIALAHDSAEIRPTPRVYDTLSQLHRLRDRLT